MMVVMSNFRDKLKDGVAQYGIALDDDRLYKFYLFYELLTEWNKKINLTTIESENDVIIKHFLDSLFPVLFEDPGNWGTTLDLGTGAGFPGIPLKITYQNLNLTLVDSTKKKIDFLNHVIKELNLENITAIHGRAEELGINTNFREKFFVVISRAVAPLNTLSEYCLPFVKTGGKMIAYKSQDIENEISEAENAIQILGGKIKNVSRETIPLSNIGRSIIIINKVTNTPGKYPRRNGVPKKKPLK